MKKMQTVRTAISKWMKDEKFKAAYKALEPEYELAAALIEARSKANLSQKDLTRSMKTTQPMITPMESGCQISSATTLLKVAKATGTRLQIKFVAA